MMGDSEIGGPRKFRYLPALICVLGVTWGSAQHSALAQQFDSRDLGNGMELFQIRPNFYVMMGAGANVGIQIGADGTVVVDAGDAAHANRLAAELKKLTVDNPIRYVINTSADADHVGGNEQVAKIGRTLANVISADGGVSRGSTAAEIMATEDVLLELSAAGFPGAALPTEAFAQRRRFMYLNNEAIEVLRQPQAHTGGDSLVFFRRSDVVMAGDIIDLRHFPVIDLERGGSVEGLIAALNRIIEIAVSSVPIISREAGTVVVPGHGRLLDRIDVVEYRDMVAIVRDRVAHLMKDGKTLAEVKAANPTQGYTKLYGSDKGPWTTDMFVEAVFKSLAAGESK